MAAARWQVAISSVDQIVAAADDGWPNCLSNLDVGDVGDVHWRVTYSENRKIRIFEDFCGFIGTQWRHYIELYLKVKSLIEFWGFWESKNPLNLHISKNFTIFQTIYQPISWIIFQFLIIIINYYYSSIK